MHAVETDTGALADDEVSYYVSMTDLMVGMVFLFVIMLMTFALNLRDAEQSNKQTVQTVAGIEATRTRLLDDVSQYLAQHGVAVDVVWEHGILRLPEDILFASGSPDLSPQGQANIDTLAHALALVLPCYSAVPPGAPPPTCGRTLGGRLEAVLIEGHSDSDPVQPSMWYRSNMGLSAFRAINTLERLNGAESLLARLTNDAGEPLFGVGGYGDTRPRVPERSDQDKQLNRRIDLRFLMATPRPADLGTIDRGVAVPAR